MHVDLSSVVNVSMTLNTVWIGSDGFIAANTSYPAVTTHTATVMIVTHLEEMNLKSTLVLQI